MIRTPLAASIAIAAALTVAGCTTAPATGPDARHGTVALGQLGPASPSPSRPFMLGAGDELGQQIFMVYVASLRAEDADTMFATGADDFPE